MASFWLKSVLLVGLSGFAAAAILCHETPDLSKVKVGADASDRMAADLVETLSQAAVKQSGTVEINEADLNDYLARRFRSSQTGESQRVAHFDRLLLNLEDDHCTAYLCWNVFGHLDVVTVQFSVKRVDKDKVFAIEIEKGAYGCLQVPRGFLTPMIPALREMVRAFQPEINAIFKLPHVSLKKDKLVLNPRF